MTAEELEENIRLFIEFYNNNSWRLDFAQHKNMLAEAVGYLDKALEYIELGNRPL